MIKAERFNKILSLVNSNGIVKVGELNSLLNVTEMTIRRDLLELEQQGKLKRVHGGATKNTFNEKLELSHLEKQTINISKKIEIAKKIANEIEENSIVFLGAGTTIELVPNYLTHSNLKVITNSLPVFNKLQSTFEYDLILIGGTYRERTGSFVGSIANKTLQSISVEKAFIGVNAIYDNVVTNYNEEEGLTQSIVLNNATDRYIVSDSTKLDKVDFYQFYDLNEANYLITDSSITEELLHKYSKYISIL